MTFYMFGRFGLVILYITLIREKLVKAQEVHLPPGQECQMTPVIHVLQHAGCVPKPIPSYACIGKCTSYVQVSGSKIWQMERSCNCCQESGEREATVVLFCPKAKSEEKRFRKVTTKAPLECMCRPCGTIEESAIIPQEIAGYSDESLQNHFKKAY
ncbi:unnamed protein product [Parnassius apollo]|uniref:Bursicon n=1 Tax=Parnassius apollo TaxID=110799 RepID=A0A8S3XKK2_PARAO|nr:unnamed protein product [Parnassius apollo]